MYCCWRSSYQEGRVSISLNPATFLCLSQARTWISKVICRGLFCVQWLQLRWEVIVGFVDIGGIDDHHCLNFLFINNNAHDKIVQIYTRKRSKFRDGLTNFRIYISVFQDLLYISCPSGECIMLYQYLKLTVQSNLY
jgi:hypothetical protein